MLEKRLDGFSGSIDALGGPVEQGRLWISEKRGGFLLQCIWVEGGMGGHGQDLAAVGLQENDCAGMFSQERIGLFLQLQVKA